MHTFGVSRVDEWTAGGIWEFYFFTNNKSKSRVDFSNVHYSDDIECILCKNNGKYDSSGYRIISSRRMNLVVNKRNNC